MEVKDFKLGMKGIAQYKASPEIVFHYKIVADFMGRLHASMKDFEGEITYTLERLLSEYNILKNS